MKKFFTMTLAITALTFGFNNAATSQIEAGNIIIDTYYGYPNFGKKLWQVLEDDSLVSNTRATGIGPFGARVEYMLADNLGVGVDFNMLTNGFEYDETYSVYNSTTNMWETETYHFSYKKTKLRVMARLNYHFVSTDVVDSYVGFGAGYKQSINKFESTDPGAVENELETGLNLVPVSVRVCIGARFFFTPFMGINMELGVGGGPLLSGGATVKF